MRCRCGEGNYGGYRFGLLSRQARRTGLGSLFALSGPDLMRAHSERVPPTHFSPGTKMEHKLHRTARRRWLAALVAAPAFVLLSAQAAHADALDAIGKRGTLRVAVPADYPPFGSVGTDMKPQGYDIDMAALLAKSMHAKVELVPVNSANRIPYLQTDKVDLIISSLGKTPDRAKVIDFSAAYAPYFQGVFGPADINVKTPADLDGKTVGATRGALEEIALTNMAPKATIRRFDDNNATIQAFLSGQVQLIAAGNVVAAAIIAKHPPRLPEMKFIIKDSPCYVGLAKNEPRLLAKVNAAIEAAKKDGELEAMSKKWLGQPLPANL